MERNALRVTACCRLARKAGVRCEMPLAEARTITGEEVDIAEHDREADRERLRELASIGRQFSPICGLEEAGEPAESSTKKGQSTTREAKHSEGLFLDIAGCGHLFGGEVPLAEAAVKEMASLGYRAKAGLGKTVGVAWAAARLARRGVLRVDPSQQTGWLNQQPVGALRLAPQVVQALAEFDLHAVGQIRQLPREQLPSRFGDQLLRRLDQADGRVPEPIVPIFPTEVPQAVWQSEDPLRRPELVNVVLENLLVDLANGLPDGVGVTELTVLFAAGAKRCELSVTLARPSRDAKRFGTLVDLQVEKTRLPTSIDRITVEASRLDLILRRQTDLFGDPLDGERARERDDLLEQLTGRLGQERVSRVQFLADPLPERVVQYTPAITSKQVMSTAAPAQMTRPLMLLVQPVEIRLWTVSQTPSRVELQGRVLDMANVWGPERIESGWWRGDDQKRDYYRVQVSTGECLWIFWQADGNRWFLHGLF